MGQSSHDLGYVEGRNLTIEWRYADNQPERLAALAAELVQMKVDVIVIPQRGHVCGQNLQGREARRSAGGATNEN